MEFAIENSLILRKRAANLVQSKSKGPQRKRPDGVDGPGDGGNKSQQKIKQAGKTGAPQSEGKESAVREDRKRKRGRDGREDRKSSRGPPHGGGQETAEQDSIREGEGDKQETKAGRKIKRGKTSGADRKAAQAKRASSKATDDDVEPLREVKPSRNPQTMVKKANKKSERAQPVKQSYVPKKDLPKVCYAFEECHDLI